jgi:hypothetical protein
MQIFKSGVLTFQEVQQDYLERAGVGTKRRC